MLFSVLGYVQPTVNNRQCFLNLKGVHTNRREYLWVQRKHGKKYTQGCHTVLIFKICPYLKGACLRKNQCTYF